MNARYIHENFIEDSDPIKDMGIGSITFKTIKMGDIIIRIHHKNFFKYIRIGDWCLIVKPPIIQDNFLQLNLVNFSQPSNSIKFYRQQLFVPNPVLRYDGQLCVATFETWDKNYRIIQPRELKQFE